MFGLGDKTNGIREIYVRATETVVVTIQEPKNSLQRGF